MQAAERRLHDSDFVGARRIAQMAQRLNPKLENINQLLAIAEVHCSSQTTISGLGFDWYEILQLQPTADQETIKKQYKKLALLLHPDKNKFYGAEAAFKLVGEANELLKDQTKRSIYDAKLSESGTTNGKETTQKQKEDFNSSQKILKILDGCMEVVYMYRYELLRRSLFQPCMLIIQECYRISQEKFTSLLEKEFFLLVEKLLSNIQQVWYDDDD